MTIEQHAEAAVREYWDAANKADGHGKAMTHYIAKHMQSAIDEATAPLRARNDTLVREIDRLESEVVRANTERVRTQEAYRETDSEVVQTLGKALHYPWFKDDQKNFPGATEADGVAVGDHVAESLAAEAAKRVAELEGLGPLIHDLVIASCRYGMAPQDRDFHESHRLEKVRSQIDAILKGGAS